MFQTGTSWLRLLTAASLLVFAASSRAEEALPRQGIEDRNEVRIEVPDRDPEGRFFREIQFLRGDTNGDARVDISDAIDLLNFLFLGLADAPGCRNAADSNSDLSLDLSDAAYTLGYLFLGSSPPAEPGPDSCGVDRRMRKLTCETYDACPDDFPLITHVLNRITFGPNEELYQRIQTRSDLIAYIEEQLAAPANYDQEQAEPEIHSLIESLRIRFDEEGSERNTQLRVKSMLLVNALESQWQLLHVVAQFWNNHFHTQVTAVRENYFSGRQLGGGSNRPTAAIFSIVDSSGDGQILEDEWIAFREEFPAAIYWADMARIAQDASLSLDEFLQVPTIAYWKYRRGFDQFAIAAELERREYDLFRRLSMGSFRDLLESSAKSVSMMIYLNGFENNVTEPNENYGREYLELSCLGADHMYTQRDIEELSRVFTGWTVGWVSRRPYSAEDIQFQENPASSSFPLNLRHPAPTNLPTTQFWNDNVYTWALLFGARNGRGQTLPDFGHDWDRKDLFLPRYGGVDSLGNPPAPEDEIHIAANSDRRGTDAAQDELDLVLERTTSFRDTAKFISTKLIQLFVTDDLTALNKTRNMPSELASHFRSIDSNRDGSLSLEEWETPIPFILPNGRPLRIFERIDVDGDSKIIPLEYQEPDLLLDCIDAWNESGGNIRAVLRAILLSDEFLSLKFYRAKIKTPFETVTSSMRALEATATLNQSLTITLDLTAMGMELFEFGDPTGESELAFDWMHTIGLLERLKFVNRGANPAPGTNRRFQWNPGTYEIRWQLTTAQRSADYFTLLLLGDDLLPEQRQLVLAAYATSRSNPIGALAAYVLSLPQYQKQ